MGQDNLLVQGAAIYINIAAPCTTTHNLKINILQLKGKHKCKLFLLLLFFFTLCLFFHPIEKLKNLLFFSFFSQNSYICTSSKSRAKQCSETRTATKSLPVTELPALYVLSVSRLKEIYRFSMKNSISATSIGKFSLGENL